MGPVNVTAMEDYRACRERYDDLAGQRDDLVKAQDDLLGIIESLQRQMESSFGKLPAASAIPERNLRRSSAAARPNCG
ncbi:MAG: hypothetical protein ACLS7Z_02460 [Christensenellales bacterium]